MERRKITCFLELIGYFIGGSYTLICISIGLLFIIKAHISLSSEAVDYVKIISMIILGIVCFYVASLFYKVIKGIKKKDPKEIVPALGLCIPFLIAALFVQIGSLLATRNFPPSPEIIFYLLIDVINATVVASLLLLFRKYFEMQNYEIAQKLENVSEYNDVAL
ncbi:hypothetical protein PVAND_014786 [Polypedilum vanderplanki]|uniref:Uncharacterized protein n=1 Tax=Polypedilum vanderplanki TaxID=319348 RepID=A0A9J6BB29_POLVA|nr:hypothetical protein PVAND_014786 [Polypedilum vanderplanki]